MPSGFAKLREKAMWASLGLGFRALTGVLMRAGKHDPMMSRALDEFTGVYRFENADATIAKYIVFEGRGKVRSLSQRDGEHRNPPDMTFTLRDPKAFRGTKSEDVLKMVIADKVGQTGNMYYLFQFGFIMSLLENYYRNKRSKKKSSAATDKIKAQA